MDGHSYANFNALLTFEARRVSVQRLCVSPPLSQRGGVRGGAFTHQAEQGGTASCEWEGHWGVLPPFQGLNDCFVTDTGVPLSLHPGLWSASPSGLLLGSNCALRKERSWLSDFAIASQSTRTIGE